MFELHPDGLFRTSVRSSGCGLAVCPKLTETQIYKFKAACAKSVIDDQSLGLLLDCFHLDVPSRLQPPSRSDGTDSHPTLADLERTQHLQNDLTQVFCSTLQTCCFFKMSLMCFYFEYEHVNKAAVSELGYLLTEQLEGVLGRT